MAVKLRFNFGSHAEVTRVYAYDPSEAVALVRVRYPDAGTEHLSEAKLTDLEALRDDAAGTFEDVARLLRERAGEVLAAEGGAS